MSDRAPGGGDLLDRLAAHARAHFARHDETPISHAATPEVIRAHLAEHFPFEAPMPDDVLFEETTRMLWQWAEHATNPRHFGLTRPTVDLPSVAADGLVALYDPNLATWEFSPAAVEIERYVLEYLGRHFGMGEAEHFACFTTGGEEANGMGVAAALTRAFPEAGERGLRALDGAPTLYLSADGHHSFDKLAHRRGIGRGAVRWVPVDGALRMDVVALRAMIEQDLADGHRPFLVAATAGTVSAGMVDPLPALAEVARTYDLWLHVDGAWGCAAALSPSLRSALAGIERADSVTFDAHKWLSVPVGAGMFFSKHRAPVLDAFGTSAPYAPPRNVGRDYPYVSTPQWSRRFIGLKVFMMLAARGRQAVVRRIEHQARIGDVLRAALVARGWRLLNEATLPVVNFTHESIEPTADAHRAIVDHVIGNGRAWISRVRLGNGIEALRASITNFNTTEKDVEALADAVEDARRSPRGEPAGARATSGHSDPTA